MAGKQPVEDKTEATAAELRALIREAHEAAQTLRSAVREARAVVDDYLGGGVQQALNAYTGQIQQQIDTAMGILTHTANERLAELNQRLQAVADGHDDVFTAMALITAASMTAPVEGHARRRAKMIEIGKQLGRTYARHGLTMRQVTELDEESRRLLGDLNVS